MKQKGKRPLTSQLLPALAMLAMQPRKFLLQGEDAQPCWAFLAGRTSLAIVTSARELNVTKTPTWPFGVDSCCQLHLES